ncbi:23S rRNA (adenine(1618)-N(6))-methyltransferase RlmF [Aggregatimonas sangjinii]|nr:23S rRNA (adenine(1618)-N(6))-methyltransferase RlmF [Aggregatimonas sangjinii]
MPSGKRQEKTALHIRNKNRERYDLPALIQAVPELESHVRPNKYGAASIDFSDPRAVKLLNTALLHHYYGIHHWSFPDGNLCPPIPGRADYLHHIADLLGESNQGDIPLGENITCLDVGVGASCIYPIIGVVEYGWSFIGSDSDPKSIASAGQIVEANAALKGKVECRLQKNPRFIFQTIWPATDKIDAVICNPPFHASLEDAQKGTKRKIKNLSGKKTNIPQLNFSGLFSELIYEGGELKFIQNMIWESRKYAKNCFWFTTLVSKKSHLKGIYKLLEKVEAKQIKTIPMGTGNKQSRIVAWTFLSEQAQAAWVTARW